MGLEGIQAAWVLSLHIHLEKEKAISANKRSSGGLLVQNEWQKVTDEMRFRLGMDSVP